MKLLLPALALSLCAADDVRLDTTYSTERALRVEVTSSFELETVEMSIEVDGESREGFGAGARSQETRRAVHVDRVLVAKDGAPVKVRRTFEELSAEGTLSFADQEQDSSRECPLAETVLELELVDGEVEVEVVEGTAPDDELLQGHRPELALDALLPDGELEEGDEYDLEADAIVRALGADIERALYPRPLREPDDAGEGRRGRRGMRGRGVGAGQLIREGEWDATATLREVAGEYEGVPCAVVALELACTGELPEPEPREGGGRRGGGRSLTAPTASYVPLATEFELELDGTLYVSIEDRRPLALELEGGVTIESERTRSRGESEMTMRSLQEGRFTYHVAVSTVSDGDDSSD